MHSHIIIYSADRVRGGILKKILEISGIHSLLYNKIIDIKKIADKTGKIGQANKINKSGPKILLLDINKSIKTEISFLTGFVQNLTDTFVVVSGSASDMKQFYQLDLHGRLFFMDQFVPEQILLKVKNILALKIKTDDINKDIVEADLKEFLKLE